MKLKNVEEPVEIKRLALQKVKELERVLDEESIIAMFSLGSRYLPKYLWKYWSDELKENSISWQVFLRILGKCKNQVIGWVEGRVKWEELLKTIRNKLRSIGPLQR